MNHKKGILLVEDHGVNRSNYTHMLSLAGDYRINSAADGAEAVRLFSLAHDDIDLVILDVDIPILNGADTLRAMRCIDSDICCLAITAHIDHELLDNMINQGISGLMRKPFRMNDLIGWTNKLLQKEAEEADAFWP